MPRIQQPAKINVDLGEAFGNWKMGPDDELLPLVRENIRTWSLVL